MSKILCTKCGAENLDNATYCASCGSKLERPAAAKAPTLPSPAYSTSRDKKKNIAAAIAGIITFAITSFAIQRFISNNIPSLDKMMVAAADTLNSRCPIMIDQYTRMDSANVLPNKQFQCNYTLMGITKAEVNYDTVKKYIEPQLLNNIRTSPDLRVQREHKITFIYNYFDMNGLPVIRFSFGPDKYQ